MNRKEAAELLPIIKAFAEGKNIACRRKPSAIKGTNVSNDWV